MICLNCQKDTIQKLDEAHYYCKECKTTFRIDPEGSAKEVEDFPARIKKLEDEIEIIKKEREKNAEKKRSSNEW